MAGVDKGLELTEEERGRIEKNFAEIRKVLKRRDIDISNVIGVVTTDRVERAGKNVEIRFAEETAAHMNMVAFDRRGSPNIGNPSSPDAVGAP